MYRAYLYTGISPKLETKPANRTEASAAARQTYDWVLRFGVIAAVGMEEQQPDGLWKNMGYVRGSTRIGDTSWLG